MCRKNRLTGQNTQVNSAAKRKKPYKILIVKTSDNDYDDIIRRHTATVYIDDTK